MPTIDAFGVTIGAIEVGKFKILILWYEFCFEGCWTLQEIAAGWKYDALWYFSRAKAE